MIEMSSITWFLGVIGSCIAVGSLIWKLAKTVSDLTSVVNTCAEKLENLDSRNAASHERMFTRLDADEKLLNEHETRITVLERGDRT